MPFQLILNPIRDWNKTAFSPPEILSKFQLILNPIRDWNLAHFEAFNVIPLVPINLKPY